MLWLLFDDRFPVGKEDLRVPTCDLYLPTNVKEQDIPGTRNEIYKISHKWLNLKNEFFLQIFIGFFVNKPMFWIPPLGMIWIIIYLTYIL